MRIVFRISFGIGTEKQKKNKSEREREKESGKYVEERNENGIESVSLLTPKPKHHCIGSSQHGHVSNSKL